MTRSRLLAVGLAAGLAAGCAGDLDVTRADFECGLGGPCPPRSGDASVARDAAGFADAAPLPDAMTFADAAPPLDAMTLADAAPSFDASSSLDASEALRDATSSQDALPTPDAGPAPDASEASDAGADPDGGFVCTDPAIPAPSCGAAPTVRSCAPRELHVIGVYETAFPTGEIFVTISRTTPMTLVLSSYEPVQWNVQALPGVTLEQVILNGYEPQTVAGLPPGTPVLDRSGLGQYFATCGYELPSRPGGCPTEQLLSGVEAIAGVPFTSFSGCYSGDTFVVGP